MKKLIFLIALVMMSVIAIGQNSLRTEGNSLITIIPSDAAATSGTYTLPIIAGLADWSVQIIPLAGGTLTSDSVYATVKVFYSNSSGTAVWSEPKQYITSVSSTSGAASAWEFYSLRDTINNTTVALTPGLFLEGKEFTGSRIKIHIDRPASTDSVNYRVYYVIKYPQTNPQR